MPFPLFLRMTDLIFVRYLGSKMATIIFFSALFLSGVWADCVRNAKLLVTAPTKELKALSGSCLEIPCTFRPEGQIMDTSKTIYGVWIKSDPRIEFINNIIFNSSGANTRYPMKIIGNMAQKNCTTMFSNLTTQHTDKYYFRVENEAFKATASCHAIQINVKDSWSPIIQISGKQTETEVVTITCSAVTPCPHAPPQLTWDLHQGTAHITETNADGTFTTKITHTLTLTSSHDGYNLTCSAAYPVKGKKYEAQTTITLNVTRTDTGKAGDVTKWLPAVIVLIVLTGLIVLVWHFKFRRMHLQPTQVQTTEVVHQQEPAQSEENLHYEDVRFRSNKPDTVISSTQEETVYSQVKVSHSNGRAAAEMTDIYTQV